MSKEVRNSFEFIQGKLYYVALRSVPSHSKSGCVFFSVDDILHYYPFFLDFGPLNLGQTYRFCQILISKLQDPMNANKRIYYYSSTNPQKRANAAFFICAFMVLYMKKTPEEAYRPFKDVYPPFPPFHDASPYVCTYKLTVKDCLDGVYFAIQNKFFNVNTFDVEEYEHYERVECGDLNWLVEDKFLAFAGPHEARSSSPEGYHCLIPEDYISYFKRKNVTLVIRLNKKYYDERRFTNAGIKHIDLYYLDGSTPPERLLQQFIQVCEQNEGAIAVHCKAGLGRTGTCIIMYLMKHFGMTAAEGIGWLRVCRPGSVIGPQQQYLQDNEARMHRAGENMRNMMKGKRNASQSKFDDLEPQPKHSSYEHYHDDGQGDKLRAKRSSNRKSSISGRTFSASRSITSILYKK